MRVGKSATSNKPKPPPSSAHVVYHDIHSQIFIHTPLFRLLFLVGRAEGNKYAAPSHSLEAPRWVLRGKKRRGLPGYLLAEERTQIPEGWRVRFGD